MFVIIMETYLPLDYMIEGLIGAMTDQKVLENLARYRYPQLLQKLDDIKLQKNCDLTAKPIFSNCVTSWF